LNTEGDDDSIDGSGILKRLFMWYFLLSRSGIVMIFCLKFFNIVNFEPEVQDDTNGTNKDGAQPKKCKIM
jgi:hypothetical protein